MMVVAVLIVAVAIEVIPGHMQTRKAGERSPPANRPGRRDVWLGSTLRPQKLIRKACNMGGECPLALQIHRESVIDGWEVPRGHAGT